MGLEFRSGAVVLTTGTFLGGRIHIGLDNHAGGRAGDAPSNALAERLRALPFRVGRLKTGTPPRIDGRSVDFSGLEAQQGDDPLPCMSLLGSADEHPAQVSCHITYTNERTHDIIRAGLDRSPLYSGVIEGTGPRYCPSIEDKVVRFAERAAHQIFVEPEGLDSHELYPNGISTSLPFDVQLALVRSIGGFERAHVTRPGYAIEYDFFDPRDLEYSLETRALEALFFAGQINGTTGYEEAAGQGIVAGINAVRRVRGDEPVVLGRDDAYVGVLVDDLVTKGVDEPYRLFTSRAEFRLLLRQDNALRRLGGLAERLGLLTDVERTVLRDRTKIEASLRDLAHSSVLSADCANGVLLSAGESTVTTSQVVAELARRPRIGLRELLSAATTEIPEAVLDAWMSVEIEIKYAGYLDRERQAAKRLSEMADFRLPRDLPYLELHSLSTEARHKLDRIRPESLAQAGRVPGVSPSDLQNLVLEVARRRRSAA